MAEARCDRTDLPESMCAHCRPEPEPEFDVEIVQLGPTFPARYDGRCGLCQGSIEAGDAIAAVLGHGHTYACSDCVLYGDSR